MKISRKAQVALFLSATVAVGVAALSFGNRSSVGPLDEDTALANDCATLEQLQEDQKALVASYPTEWSQLEDGQLLAELEATTDLSSAAEKKLQSKAMNDRFPIYAYARADGLYYYGTMALGEMGRDQEGLAVIKHIKDNYPILATLDKDTYEDTLAEIWDLCPNLS